MSRKPKKRPSFFKILEEKDFTQILRLPPAFVQKYGSNLQEKVKLRIESGRTWDVKVETMDDGLFFFSRGWENFAQDVGLKFGEFLVFMLNDGGFSVDVSIYQTTSLKKEFPAVCTVARKSCIEKMGNNPLYYQFVLKLHQQSRISHMRSFARAAGLMVKDRVEVVGEHHKECVTLDHSHKDALRVDMTRGWKAFRRFNGLVYGKTYSFEFRMSSKLRRLKIMGIHLLLLLK